MSAQGLSQAKRLLMKVFSIPCLSKLFSNTFHFHYSSDIIGFFITLAVAGISNLKIPLGRSTFVFISERVILNLFPVDVIPSASV